MTSLFEGSQNNAQWLDTTQCS